ncbi:phosphopantetheine adenylyltransferase [Methanolobus halotolerans]|uniref:Phosphopantetheine adenylyltransferase n=1 Tax=Methanolobus halotolerans TaxID=2052935 RepID=A0A4E0PZE6_9EURY|nr:phosphopantetheine adenylyltransferase [Methanolobus halotolerans]TGC11032.1 phosphopantetheine adenylyltransferase [Methanolobus halotolerans]
MARVVVGGTFEYLHEGHRALLRKAFEIGGSGEVDIGLTSNEMANKRDRNVPDYSIRESRLLGYLKEIAGDNVDYNIIELSDPYGKTLNENYDYIVVSSETYSVALKINRIRAERNMYPLKIVKMDFVMADDGKPISSTRIARGEIDLHGHVVP